MTYSGEHSFEVRDKGEVTEQNLMQVTIPVFLLRDTEKNPGILQSGWPTVAFEPMCLLIRNPKSANLTTITDNSEPIKVPETFA